MIIFSKNIVLAKSLSLILFISILTQSSFFFVPKKAEAQSGGGILQSVLGSVGGVALSCGGGEYLSDALGGALDSILGVLGLGGSGDDSQTIDGLGNVVSGGGGSGGGNEVPVDDAVVRDYIQKVDKSADEIEARQNEQKKKEFNLDCLTRELAQTTLSMMTDSLVDWINNGFQGSPQFVSDPNGFFQSVEDQITGQVIEELGLSGLCSFSLDDIKLAISITSNRTSLSNRFQCTLSDVLDNTDDLLKDFSNAGLDDFLAFHVNSANNPYYAFLDANDEVVRRQTAEKENLKAQLDWGNGFLSKFNVDGEITLPGKIIEEQLATVLGSEVRQLELADEFNEVIAALVNALVNYIFSEAGGLL